MKRLVLIGMFACAGMLTAGCRNTEPAGGTGGTGGTGGGGGSTGGADMALAVKTYTKTTIASMRGVASGQKDVEIDNVVSLGVTPSTASPKIFVQDSAGGDFSAIEGECETGSTTHPCAKTVGASVNGIADGHSVTIQGTYQKSKTGFEVLYIDSITDNGAGTMPAPTTVQLADIGRSANSTKYWFQIVTVDTAGTAYKPFDFSPAEFKYTGTATNGCPAMFGWGMVPATSSDTVGAACSGTTQPASAIAAMAMPPTDEIMIGTDFYKGFTYTSDCACAATYKDTLVTAANMLTGTITGVLIGDVPYMGTVSYQYIAPKANAAITLQ